MDKPSTQVRLRSGFDYVIMACMLGVAAFSAKKVFLEQYILKLEDSSVSVPLALLSDKKSTVKLRLSNSIAWKDALGGDDLSLFDQVYTHENSEATIRFGKNKSIGLGEKTLFRLSKFENDVGVEIQKGIVRTNLNSENDKIKIKIKDKVLEVQGTKDKKTVVEIVGTKDKASIVLLSGEAKIKSKEKAFDLKKNQQLKVKENEEATVELIPVEYIFPKSQAKIFYNKKNPIRFSWKASEQSDSYRVLIAKDLSFSRTLKRNVEGETELILPLKKGKGNHYWRVDTKIKDKWVQGPPRAISIYPNRAPKVLSPPDKTNMEFTREPILVEWKERAQAKYQLKVIYPEGEEQIFETENNYYQIEANQEGPYQVQVKAVRENYPDSLWSKRKSFSILPALPPEIPEIFSPKNNQEDYVYSDKPEKIQFRWPKKKGNKRFEIKVENSNGREVYRRGDITTPGLDWAPEDFGKFTFFVRGVSSKDQTSDWSQVIFTQRQVKVFPKPEQGAMVELTRPNEKVTFKWGAKEKVRNPRYILEVSKEQSFENIQVRKEVESEEAEAQFKEVGTYFWRAKLIRPDGSEAYSKPKQITIKPTPPPSKPQLDPMQKIQIKLEKLQGSFFEKVFEFFIKNANAETTIPIAEITLPENKDAKKYIVEIYSDSDGKDLMLRRESTSPTIRWQSPKAGTFYWRMAIIDYWDRTSPFSDFSKLELTLPDEVLQFQAPRLTSPKHKSNFLTNEKKIEFSWTDVPNAEGYTVLLSTDLSFDEIVLKRNTSSPYLKVDMERIKSHPSLYWRVLAKGPMRKSKKSKRRLFTLKAPPPPKPKKIKKKERPIVLAEGKKSQKKMKKKPKKVSLWLASFNPSSDSLTIEGPGYTGDVSGTVLMSFGLTHKRDIGSSQFLFTSSLTKGTVFTDQSYQFLNLAGSKLNHLTMLGGLNWSYGANILTASGYKSDGTKITGSGALLLQASLGLSDSNSFELGHHWHIHVMAGMGMTVEAFYSYAWRGWFTRPLSLGVGYRKQSYTVDEVDHDKSSIFLSFGTYF